MITKKRSTNPILRWIQNEDNMNLMYGLGAAVVILGALFKLQGWPFANEMLNCRSISRSFNFCNKCF